MATVTATMVRRPRGPQPHVTLDELTERRRALGLSQARMSMLADVNPNIVSDIACGRLPLTANMARRLDSALREAEERAREARA